MSGLDFGRDWGPVWDGALLKNSPATFIRSSQCSCETWSLTLREEHRLRVFESRMLRIFGPTRDGVTGEWRKLHNVELNGLYCSPNIVRVIKSRKMRWAGHVARMEEGRGVHKVLVGKSEGKSHWGDKDVDGRIILRWILRKWEGIVGTGWSWLRIGTGGGRL